MGEIGNVLGAFDMEEIVTDCMLESFFAFFSLVLGLVVLFDFAVWDLKVSVAFEKIL